MMPNLKTDTYPFTEKEILRNKIVDSDWDLGMIATLEEILDYKAGLKSTDERYEKVPRNLVACAEFIIGENERGEGLGIVIQGPGLIMRDPETYLNFEPGYFEPTKYVIRNIEHDTRDGKLDNFERNEPCFGTVEFQDPITSIRIRNSPISTLIEGLYMESPKFRNASHIQVMNSNKFRVNGHAGPWYAVVLNEYEARAASQEMGHDLKTLNPKNPLLQVFAGGRDKLEHIFRTEGDIIKESSPGKTIFSSKNYHLPRASLVKLDNIGLGVSSAGLFEPASFMYTRG